MAGLQQHFSPFCVFLSHSGITFVRDRNRWLKRKDARCSFAAEQFLLLIRHPCRQVTHYESKTLQMHREVAAYVVITQLIPGPCGILGEPASIIRMSATSAYRTTCTEGNPLGPAYGSVSQSVLTPPAGLRAKMLTDVRLTRKQGICSQRRSARTGSEECQASRIPVAAVTTRGKQEPDCL